MSKCELESYEIENESVHILDEIIPTAGEAGQIVRFRSASNPLVQDKRRLYFTLNSMLIYYSIYV